MVVLVCREDGYEVNRGVTCHYDPVPETGALDASAMDVGVSEATCETAKNLATTTELESTPRVPYTEWEQSFQPGIINQELLALTVTENLVVPDDVFERVRDEVGAVYAAHPELRHISFHPIHDGRTLKLYLLDRDTTEAMAYGRYPRKVKIV